MTSPLTGQEPPSLLIVEDDPVLRDLAAELLGINGYICRAVGTVSQAVAAVERHHPVWAIVDFQLSDGDGLNFLHEVRALAIDDYRVKVIAVTGWESKVGRVGEFIGAADHYLLKPVNWDHLLHITSRS